MLISSLVIILVNLLSLSLVFFSIFIICEEHLVIAIEVFINQYKVPEELAAVTLVAFGSAVPELLLNIVAVLQDPPSSDISMSAVLGSAIIAFGLIPSVVIILSPTDCVSFKPMPILRETSFYLLGLVMFLCAIFDGFVDTIEAVYLVGIYLLYVMSVYISTSMINSKSEDNKIERIDEESLEFLRNEADQQHMIEDVTLIEKNEISLYRRLEVTLNHFVAENVSKLWGYVIPHLNTASVVSKQRALLVLLASVFFVGCHSFILIYLSQILISFLSVESSTMGATLISMGSEIPDLIGAIALMRRGYYDGALASAIGSQVINITIGIGVPSIILCLKESGTYSIPRKEKASYEMLIGILIVIIVLYTSPFFAWFFRYRRRSKKIEVNKLQGRCLLILYFLMSALFVYYN